MLNSKTNRIALYVSAFIVIALVLFALLRDNASPITLKDATKILQNHTVQKVIVTKEYVYLKTEKNNYKIASSQVTPKMFIDYKVDVETGTNIIVYLLSLVLFLGLGSLALRWWQKRTDSSNLFGSQSSNISSLSHDSTPVEAIKSDVTFKDIGGISDVKIELEEIIDFIKNPKRYKSFWSLHAKRCTSSWTSRRW